MATRIQNTRTSTSTSTSSTKDTSVRKEMLLKTFVETLFDETHLAFREMIDNGEGNYIHVSTFCLPNQGASARATYWTGKNDDATKDGIPIVMLLQGERDRETGTLHPERLPGGKTAIDLVNERLDQAEAGASISLFFNKRTKDLHIYLYDHAHREQFNSFIDKKKQERPPRPPREPREQRESQTEKPKPNMSEWFTTKLKTHTSDSPSPQTPALDGFQEVRRRK